MVVVYKVFWGFFFLKGSAALTKCLSSKVRTSCSCYKTRVQLPYSDITQSVNQYLLHIFHVSTVLQILKMPFWASTSIHYTPRHSCCAHLPLSAAAPSCDQPDPTVPYVDTSIVSAMDDCEFKKKKMTVALAFLHTVRPAVCL